MRIIGLTGTIGAGKSTVARWLAEWGAHAVDADALVHRLYESDATLQAQLRARFGAGVIVDGRVHRPTLGQIVFGDPAALADLEALVHPAVHRLEDEAIAAARAAGAPACVIEATKMVESGGSARCDELWIVVAGEAVQVARLLRRGVDEAEARRRLASQGSVASWSAAFLAESVRLGRSRPIVVFDNSGSEAQGREQVARLWRGIPPADPPEPQPPGSPEALEQAAIRLERERRYDDALAVCEQALRDPGLGPLEEAQFAQRRLRLLRKLGVSLPQAH